MIFSVPYRCLSRPVPNIRNTILIAAVLTFTGAVYGITSGLLWGVDSQHVWLDHTARLFPVYLRLVFLISLIMLRYMKPIVRKIKKMREKVKSKRNRRKEGVRAVMQVLLKSQETLDEIMTAHLDDSRDPVDLEATSERIEDLMTEIDNLPADAVEGSLKDQLTDLVSDMDDLIEFDNPSSSLETGSNTVSGGVDGVRSSNPANAIPHLREVHNILSTIQKQKDDFALIRGFGAQARRFKTQDIVPMNTGDRDVVSTLGEVVGSRFHAKTIVEYRGSLRVSSSVRTIHTVVPRKSQSLNEWMQQTKRDIEFNKNPYTAAIHGYVATPNVRALVFQGDLLPIQDYLQQDMRGLAKLELMVHAAHAHLAATNYILTTLGFDNSFKTFRAVHSWLLYFLHYDRAHNCMVLCGDLSDWDGDSYEFWLAIFKRARSLRMFTPLICGYYFTEKPNFMDTSRLYRDASDEEKREALFVFYKTLLACRTVVEEPIPIPFYMRGIHADPRIRQPCPRNWCSPPNENIWTEEAVDMIRIPTQHSMLVNWQSPFQICPPVLASTPHVPPSRFFIWEQGSNPFNPLCILPANEDHARILFANAGRIFASPQFHRSKLERSDMFLVQPGDWEYLWALSSDDPLDSVPTWKPKLSFHEPFMDQKGFHLPLTKWEGPPGRREMICESNKWAVEKCFWFKADICFWEDHFYDAIHDFHRALGFDPESAEVAEFLNLPILDPEDLFHPPHSNCVHGPFSGVTHMTHRLTVQDLNSTWDPLIDLGAGYTKEGDSVLDRAQVKALGLRSPLYRAIVLRDWLENFQRNGFTVRLVCMMVVCLAVISKIMYVVIVH